MCCSNFFLYTTHPLLVSWGFCPALSSLWGLRKDQLLSGILCQREGESKTKHMPGFYVVTLNIRDREARSYPVARRRNRNVEGRT